MKYEPKEIAEWMKSEIELRSWLTQKYAASEIRKKFGKEATYRNENRNSAIQSDVLEEFRKITDETVVWVKGRRAWRLRQPSDPLGVREVIR